VICFTAGLQKDKKPKRVSTLPCEGKLTIRMTGSKAQDDGLSI